MSDTAAVNLNPKHFSLLRIAKLRALRVRKIGAETFAVTSFTRPGIEWVISGGVCTCPAKGFCTHLAAVTDHHYINDATPADYTLYTCAMIDDRAQLKLRIRSGHTTKNDRTYMRYCIKFYTAKLAKVKVPPVTERVVREGRRTRTVTRCGAFIV